MGMERKQPAWLRIILNLCGPIGLGVTLMGWVRPVWGLAVMTVGIVYVVWEIYPWTTDKIQRRPRMSLVVLMVIGAGLGAVAWWCIRKSAVRSAPAPISASASLPHLKLSLILDSITDKEVTWHLVPSTDRRIENMRVRYVTSGAAEDEIEPRFPRILSPGDELSLTGPPIFLKPHSYNRLDVTLIYALPGNTKDQFATTFHYFFMADRTGDFQPESIGEPAKVSEPQMQEGGTNVLAALRQSAGTVEIVLNELNQSGQPNVASGGNQLRTITFNPVNKTATFTMKLASGKSLIFTGQLAERLNGFHNLCMTWDDDKGTATFTVDGVPIEAQPPVSKKPVTPGHEVGAQAGDALPQQPPSQIVSAPNGIAIGGGTVTNPTVINNAPLQRVIPQNVQDDLVRVLKQYPGEVRIESDSGDFEANTLAKQLFSIFDVAGWRPIEIGYLMGGESLPQEIQIGYRGPAPTPGQMTATIPSDQPAAFAMVRALYEAGFRRITIIPNPDRKANTLLINVGHNTEATTPQ